MALLDSRVRMRPKRLFPRVRNGESFFDPLRSGVRFSLAAPQDHIALEIKRAEHEDLLERVWTLRDPVTAYDAAYVVFGHLKDSFRILQRRRIDL